MGGGPRTFNTHSLAFFVVRGKSALSWLVVRNGFAHFIRKVFARRKLLPGKFGVFAPLQLRTYSFGLSQSVVTVKVRFQDLEESHALLFTTPVILINISIMRRKSVQFRQQKGVL